MMKRILAPTDLSANSKTGLMFAMQLAQKNNVTLEFIYVLQVLHINFADIPDLSREVIESTFTVPFNILIKTDFNH